MKVLFIYTGLHKAHQPFIEAINADLCPVYDSNTKGFRRFVNAFKMAKNYPDYDVYIIEGGMPMFPVFIRKYLLNKKISLLDYWLMKHS